MLNVRFWESCAAAMSIAVKGNFGSETTAALQGSTGKVLRTARRLGALATADHLAVLA